MDVFINAEILFVSQETNSMILIIRNFCVHGKWEQGPQSLSMREKRDLQSLCLHENAEKCSYWREMYSLEQRFMQSSYMDPIWAHIWSEKLIPMIWTKLNFTLLKPLLTLSKNSMVKDHTTL